MMFKRQLKSEMPKVKLPRDLRFLCATGALRVQLVGYHQSTNEFVYTTQLRRWHPLSWVLAFFTAQFIAAIYFTGLYAKMEWRASNG